MFRGILLDTLDQISNDCKPTIPPLDIFNMTRQARRPLLVRVESECWDQIERVAQSNGWTKQELFTRALSEFLESHIERYDMIETISDSDAVMEEASRQLEALAGLVKGVVRARKKKNSRPSTAGVSYLPTKAGSEDRGKTGTNRHASRQGKENAATE